MKKYLEKYQKFEPLTVVCIGDSTTSQEWCHPNWVDWMNFVFKHEEDSPVGRSRKIINSAEDGQTAQFFIENFEKNVLAYKPDVVVVSLGTNELEFDQDPEPGLRDLFRMINSAEIEIIAWTPYPMSGLKYSNDLAVLRDTYKKLCEEFDVTFIDIFTEFGKYDQTKLFSFIRAWDGSGMKTGDIDIVHCNTIGNQIIAERILEAFETDLSVTEEWKMMGTMQPVNLKGLLKKA
jgi:lysophospholipase L1-like esterase